MRVKAAKVPAINLFVFISKIDSIGDHYTGVTFRRGVQFAVGTGGWAEHRKPPWCHSYYAMRLRHTHSDIYEEVRGKGRKAYIEVHSTLTHLSTEESFVRLRKVRQRDVVCGQGSHADEQGEEAQ